jgi:hypothetical protein
MKYNIRMIRITTSMRIDQIDQNIKIRSDLS